MSDIRADARKQKFFLSHSFKDAPKITGTLKLQRLLDTAKRPRICETNVVTDPATGKTSIVLQFPKHPPVAFSFTLDDWDEFQERMDVALKNAGFGR